MNKQLEEEVRLISLGRGRPVTVIDFDAIQKANNERVKQRDIDHPPKADPVTKQLDALVQRHFDLKNNCKHAEALINESAGQLHLLEKRIAEMKKLRDRADSDGNVLARNNYDAVLRRLEGIEFIDRTNELKRLRRDNKNALDQLKAFEAEHLPRIEELRKQVAKK